MTSENSSQLEDRLFLSLYGMMSKVGYAAGGVATQCSVIVLRLTWSGIRAAVHAAHPAPGTTAELPAASHQDNRQ
ncbi:unnamed protein product [Nezara viridula]|uniref:Uncharacterized protein n=1 Tax=Nezara viridula TaxID=85310 RepID=A0A9P0E8U5_NEZVI|nr:unnamed protein product [Nezara viridula]